MFGTSHDTQFVKITAVSFGLYRVVYQPEALTIKKVKRIH